MYNFGELKTKTAILAQRSGDSDYLLKIADWLNFAQDRAVQYYDFWQALQAEPWRFSSVANQEKYYIPSDFDKPFRIFDTTNHKKMTITTREEYYDGHIASIADVATGEPQWTMIYGVSAVARATSGSFTVKAKSSSNSDNLAVTVRIEGWLDSAKTILGYENISIDTSSPTTYVTALSPTTFYGITRVTKSADTTGFITLADSSTNILATIAPNDRESRYPVLYLGLIPDAVNVYEILYKKKTKKLVDDNDYPFMDCSDFLILYALGFSFTQEKESETRAEAMFKKADEALLLLMRNEQGKFGPDFQHQFVNLSAQSHRS